MKDLTEAGKINVKRGEMEDFLRAKEADTLLDTFSRLSGRLAGYILKRKTIRESALNDFSKIAIAIIENTNDQVTVSENFKELVRTAMDYWRYGLNAETDQKRGYSYVRLFQIVQFVDLFYKERELERSIHSELGEYSKHNELMSTLRNSPGITLGRLKADGKVADLSEKLHALEKRGHLIVQRSGDESYYVLSERGERLYRQLTGRGKKKWVDQWSDKRIYVLWYVLWYILHMCPKNTEKPFLVSEIESIIAYIDETVIAMLFEEIIADEKETDIAPNMGGFIGTTRTEKILEQPNQLFDIEKSKKTNVEKELLFQ